MHNKKENIKEVVEYSLEKGDDETLKAYNISVITLERYKYDYGVKFGKDTLKRKELLKKINTKFTDDELNALVNGKPLNYSGYKKPIIDFDGKHLKFGVISDTHYGSMFFDEKIHDESVKVFKEENVDFIVHAGDISEGMSHRPGHVYELAHIGYEAQRKFAGEMLKAYDKDVYCIDGNHDRWFHKSIGAEIGEELAEQIDKIHFLGHDEGSLLLGSHAKLTLWHGEDGSSYALSYRLQKKVESFQGGDKPNILIAGHDHKSGYFPLRNIHCLAAGSIQKQTAYMRAKRLDAHVGFWVCDAWLGKKGISKFQQCFYAVYFE
jgi:predicted phosphodiesterase